MCIADALKEFAKTCNDKKNCPLSRLNIEYLRSGVFYACIDPELKEKYKELIESGDFQESFENFLISQL